VKLLLEQEDANPDKPDIVPDRVPLSRAAENGHKGVVRGC